jgi:hypothetical protein
MRISIQFVKRASAGGPQPRDGSSAHCIARARTISRICSRSTVSAIRWLFARRAPLIQLRKSRADPVTSRARARNAQKTRARSVSGSESAVTGERIARNDLHGKNAPHGSNARVKNRGEARRPAVSLALSVVSAARRHWHVRCSSPGGRRKGENTMELFKCQQCGRKFDTPEELRKHEQECAPARVK